MKRISILAFIALILALNGCGGKSKAEHSEHNTSTQTQRSEAAKAMDSELLPEGGGKKLPMF